MCICVIYVYISIPKNISEVFLAINNAVMRVESTQRHDNMTRHNRRGHTQLTMHDDRVTVQLKFCRQATFL